MSTINVKTLQPLLNKLGLYALHIPDIPQWDSGSRHLCFATIAVDCYDHSNSTRYSSVQFTYLSNPQTYTFYTLTKHKQQIIKIYNEALEHEAEFAPDNIASQLLAARIKV